MDNYYERLNQAFANWNGGGEPSLEQRVENLEAEIIQKQDILTFDTEPVENSENPVTSGGLFSQFERYATKAALNEKVDTSNFTTDQDRQETEIGVVANRGAKNLLKITATSQTIKGVTFTVNDDQTVTVNGTNDGTGASAFVLVPIAQAITIPDGNYILSGCPADGGVPFDLRWYMYSPGKSAYDFGNGASIEKSGNTTTSNIAIVVKTGQTANNLVFKPMLRPAEITNSTYAPYAPTNRELYEMILALQSGS